MTTEYRDLANEVYAVALIAAQKARWCLNNNGWENGAELLTAASAALSALRAPELAAAHAEIAEVREALRVREGTATVDAARSCFARNKKLVDENRGLLEANQAFEAALAVKEGATT